MDEKPKFPPPPPQRPQMTPQDNQQPTPQQQPAEAAKNKRALSEKARFGLMIAGGVLSLAVSAAFLVLLFIL